MAEGVVFLFVGDLVKAAFLKVIILKVVWVSDFVTGGSVMACFLIEWEDGAKEEGPVFRTADS